MGIFFLSRPRIIHAREAAMEGGAVVGAVCLVVGLMLIGVGAYLGVKYQVRATSQEAHVQLARARQEIQDASAQIDQVRNAVTGPQLEGVGGAEVMADAASKAADSNEKAQSALEQVGSIIGSLPENMRFAGMLVLVGTVLVSVSTIQFGGTSLF
jgi:hypothetical protein